MSAAKKLVLVLALAMVWAAAYSTPVCAQMGPGNPSGGTSLLETRVEGSSPFLPTDFLSPGPESGFRTWMGIIRSRYSFTTSSRRLEGRSALAVIQRKVRSR